MKIKENPFWGLILVIIIALLVINLFCGFIYFSRTCHSQEEKSVFINIIISTGMLCVSVASLWATLYVAKAVHQLTTEAHREDYYTDKIAYYFHDILSLENKLRTIDENDDPFSNRQELIIGIKRNIRHDSTMLIYYLSRTPNIGDTSLIVKDLETYCGNIYDYEVLNRINSQMVKLFSKKKK